MRRLSNAALALLAPALLAVSSASHARAIELSVAYEQRLCERSPDRVPKLVSAGTLQVHFAGSAPISVILGKAPVKVNLDGEGALVGDLVLDTPRVKVVQDTSSNTAQRISLGRVTIKGSSATFFVRSERDETKPGDINRDESHVNVLVRLDRAADFAAQSSPVPLAKVTARVYDCSSMAAGTCPETAFAQPDTINVGQTNGIRSQWEANAMAHEYGHFVMSVVAPGGPSGGAHKTRNSYTDRPDLAWTEGFGYAFSALVNNEGQGVLLDDCSPNMNLANQPASPALETGNDEWFAQYNETRAAAVTYQLVDHLGGDVRGLRQLLTAMAAYQRDSHYVWVMRDLRDLAVTFETTGADHAAIDRIFERQGMNWSQGFSVSLVPGADLGRASESEIRLSITGPGGFDCHADHDIIVALSNLDDGRPVMGDKAADGGLSYSKNDDCYLVSGDGHVPNGDDDPHGLGNDVVTMPFPYLAGKAHWKGDFTVTARYACAYDQGLGTRWQFKCPDTVALRTYLAHIPLLSKARPDAEYARIVLKKNQDVVIATFSADGKCHAGEAMTDCSF